MVCVVHAISLGHTNALRKVTKIGLVCRVEDALTRRDEFGRVMTPKQAFREVCYRQETVRFTCCSQATVRVTTCSQATLGFTRAVQQTILGFEHCSAAFREVCYR